MDEVYAKVKRLRRKPLRKVVSGERLFEPLNVDLADSIEYTPSALLDEGEWFKVTGFSERSFYPGFIPAEFASADYADLTRDEFENISILISVQDGGYYFQRVRPSSVVRKKSVAFGDVAVVESASKRIFLDAVPEAVYFPTVDTLIFRDLAGISSIFPGIDALYREATEEQVAEFLAMDFVVADGLAAKEVSKPNRRRIALALETLGKLSVEDRSKLLLYTHGYLDGRLKFNESKSALVVTSDDDLKLLVFGIEQRFYTTEIGSERRLANSVISL